MKRNPILTVMVLGALLTLAACSSDSPTSPPASPTPTAFSISLTASPTEAVVNSAVVVAARVTSGGQNVADGTSVTFLIKGCVPNSATTPHFENGTCEMVRTTQAGGATAVMSSQVDGAWEVSARVPNAQASLVVNFYQPTDPQTLALYSITPTRGPSTGGQQVTIRGRGFAKPLLVEFVVDNQAFTAQIAGVNTAGTEITAITPAVNPETSTAEQTASVKVTAAAGTDSPVTATMTSAYVFEKKFSDPRIYQIVPDRGITTGGEPVTIYGANFVEPVKVMFGEENAQVSSVTADQIRVLTPRHSGEANTVAVTVYTRFGTAQQQVVTRADAFTWIPPVTDPGAPLIYSIVPDRGSARGGEEVTILGANLCGQVVTASGECYSLPTVTFQIGAPVNATRAAEVIGGTPDGRSLRVRTPEATPEPLTQDAVASVIVTNASGSYTAAGAFTYLHETTDPQLFSVQPNRGSPRGGEDVRLVGRNFTAPVKVEFIIGTPLNVTYPAEVLSVSDDGTEILISTPQASPNPVTTDVDVAIRITTMVGSANSRTGTFNNAFTYVGESRPPIIYYLDPDKGSREGREEVTVYGRYFIRPVTVTFEGVGDAEVTDVAADGTTITILTPPARITLPADGKVDVTVVSEAGTGRDQQVTLADGFQYLEAESPEIYSLAPNSGPVEGGTRVTINGRGFQYPVQVMFNVMGSDRQAQVVSVNYTTVVCISPSITATQPTTPAIAQVRVVNATTGKESNSLPFRYGDAMFISAIAPAAGPDLGGQQVTIFGQGFVAPVAVTIAGVAAQPLTVSGTEIVAITGAPADRTCGNRSGPVVVTNINSNISATGPTYTYQPARPLITRVVVIKQGVDTGDNVVQQYDPLGIAACNDADHPPYDQYEVVVYGENFERRPNSTNSAMTVIFENPPVEVLTTWVSQTEIRFQLPDLSQVEMAQAACTSGGAVGTRDIPTGLPFTVKNNNNNCEDRLNPALILEPCDPTCRVGVIQVDLAPDQLTLNVGTSAVMTVCINAIQATPTQVVISQSGPSGVVTFDPDGPGGDPAAPTITVTIPAGSACTTFYVNGLTGGGPVAVTAALPVVLGGDTDTSQVTVGALGILLTPENLNLPVGGTGTITVQLSAPAPAGGADVTVTLAGPAGVVDLDWSGDPGDPPNDSTFTVTIPAGSSSFTFTCEGLTAGGPVTVTGTLAPALGGASDSSTVVVGQYTVTLTPEDLLLAPGGTGNFTVTLDAPAPPGGLVVTLTQTGQAGVISIPASVTINAGTQSATFQVTAIAAGGPIVVTATLPSAVGGASDSSTVTVAAYTVTLSPESMNLGVGQTGNFTVTLNRPASPAAIIVTLTQTGPAGIITMPATVTIGLNQTTATFQVTALAEGGPVTITASLPPSLNAPPDSSTVTVGALTINANPTSLTIPVGGTGTFILALSAPAPAPITVTASSGNTGVATVAAPPAPHFATGTNTTAAFTVTGVALGTTTIYCQLPAAYGGGTAQVAVTVANYQLTAIPTSLTIAPGGSGTFILQLNQPAPAGGATITLASSNPQAATLGSATATIAAGATQSGPVTVNGVNVGSTTITATLPAAMGGSAVNVQVTVANYTLTAVPSSVVVAPGGTATFIAQLNIPAPAGGLVVNAQSNNTLVATVAPANLAIAAGGTVTGNYTVTGITAGTTTITLSLPASVGGATATVNVNVANYTLTAVPTTLTVPWRGWNSFYLQLNQAAPAGGLTVSLASSDTRIANPVYPEPLPVTVITTTTINGGSLTSPVLWAYGNNIGNATIYAQLDATGSTAQVAVEVTDAIKFVPAGLTVPVGSSATFTLQIATALNTSVDVQLDYSGTNGALWGPSIVTIPAGSTTETFRVFGLKPTISAVNIVATMPDSLPRGLGGATATGTVTVTGDAYALTLTPSTINMPVGSTVTVTGTLNHPAPPGWTTGLLPLSFPLTMSAGGSSVITLTGTLSFGANALTDTFDITGDANGGPITVTATGPMSIGRPTAEAFVTVGPGLATLLVDPTAIAWYLNSTDLTAPLNLTVTPTQANDLVIQVVSSNPAVADPANPSVTITGGTNTASLDINIVGQGTCTLTLYLPAALGGGTQTVPVWVFDYSLTPTTLTVPVGGTGDLTLTLTPDPDPQVTVGVTYSSANISGPASVAVNSPATIPVTGNVISTNNTVGLTFAAENGGEALTGLGDIDVTALTAAFSPTSALLYYPGTPTTVTLTLSGNVPTNTPVAFTWGNTNVSVNGDSDGSYTTQILAGTNSVDLTLVATSAAGASPFTLSANVNAAVCPPAVDATMSITLTQNAFTFVPTPLLVPVTTTVPWQIQAAAPVSADTTITLTNSNPGRATVPATLTLPGDGVTTTVDFNVTGLNYNAPNPTITASAAGFANGTGTIDVTPITFTVTPNPITVKIGASIPVTITLDGGVVLPAAAVINLTPGITDYTVPPTVTIPAGASSVTFDLTGAGLSGPFPDPMGVAFANTTLNATGSTVNVTVLPYTVTVSPANVTWGYYAGSQIFTLTLDAPAPRDVDVQLLSFDPGPTIPAAYISAPASVQIPSGATSATVDVIFENTMPLAAGCPGGGGAGIAAILPADLGGPVVGPPPMSAIGEVCEIMPLILQAQPSDVDFFVGSEEVITVTAPTTLNKNVNLILNSSYPSMVGTFDLASNPTGSLTLASGTTSGQFKIRGLATNDGVGNPVQITATSTPANVAIPANVNVDVRRLQLRFNPSSATITQGTTITRTVSLNVSGPLAIPVTVTFTSTDPSIAYPVQTERIISPPATSTTVDIYGNSPGGPVFIKANLDPALGGGEASLEVGVNPASVPNQPVITTITPTAGPTGGGTVVTITGTNFNADAIVTFDPTGVPAPCTVTSQTATQLVCTTTSHAAALVDVRVTNVAAALSATQVNGFAYYNTAMVATSVSPAFGNYAGGDTVTIAGSGFTPGGAYTVSFGGNLASSVTAVDNGTITCVTPPLAPNGGIVNVVLTDGMGQVRTLANAYTYYRVPTVSSVAPAYGPAAGGTLITIAGNRFVVGGSYTVTLDLGGTPAACTGVNVLSLTQMQCTTTAHAAGTVDVSVDEPVHAPVTLASAFTYVGAMTVTSALTGGIPAGLVSTANAVTITGTGFESTAGPYTVTFGGVAATGVTVVNSTTITCNTPNTIATPQMTSVVVSDGIGNVQTLPNYYGFYPAAYTIASSTPRYFIANTPQGGVVVNASPGTTFTPGGSYTVLVQATAITPTAVTANTITFDMPSFTAARRDLQIRDIRTTTSNLLTNYIHHYATPTIASALTAGSPYGLTSLANAVTITGTNFLGAGSYGVTFGGQPATAVTVVNSTTITCNTPLVTPGAIVDVVLTDGAGQSAQLANYYGFYAGAYTITGITPNRIAAGVTQPLVVNAAAGTFTPGGTYTVTVTGYAAVAATAVTDSAITFTQVNPVSGKRNVYITDVRGTNSNTLTNPNNLWVFPAPSITGLALGSGPTGGSTGETINGTFLAGGTYTVSIGGQAATVGAVTATTITCDPPAHASGVVDVVVTDVVGQSATLTNGYAYVTSTLSISFTTTTANNYGDVQVAGPGVIGGPFNYSSPNPGPGSVGPVSIAGITQSPIYLTPSIPAGSGATGWTWSGTSCAACVTSAACTVPLTTPSITCGVTFTP